MDKRMFKKVGEELQQYLAFKRRGTMEPIHKGKGSKYDREEEKRKMRKELEE